MSCFCPFSAFSSCVRFNAVAFITHSAIKLCTTCIYNNVSLMFPFISYVLNNTCNIICNQTVVLLVAFQLNVL